MGSKSRRMGLERTGNVQVLVGGLVLFLSGTMFGGYVVWSQLKGQPTEPASQVFFETQEPIAEIPNDTEIPRAHAFGSKSFLIAEPGTESASTPESSTKWAPSKVAPVPIEEMTKEQFIQMGTKSGRLILPRDFNSGSGKGSVQTPQPLPAPPMLIGTKSAPVFTPDDINSKGELYRVVSPATNLPNSKSKALVPQKANPLQANPKQQSVSPFGPPAKPTPKF